MRHIIVPIIFACLFFSYEHPSACTVFYASIGDVVLAGNNEDWKNPNTKIWFVPAKDGKYGGVYFVMVIGDATGDAAIIGAFGVVRKKGQYLVATNFQQSEARDVKKYSCPRYRVASDMLQNCPELTVDYCRKVLSATHQKGKFCTRYSNIYDLKKQRVYLYHMHDFNNAVVIDLKTELKKGKRTIELPSLFAGPANDEQEGP